MQESRNHSSRPLDLLKAVTQGPLFGKQVSAISIRNGNDAGESFRSDMRVQEDVTAGT